MWNQGNGQGNGYQQPQYQQQNQGYSQDPYDRFNNAKPINNRDPYIEEGTHTLAVISIEEIPARDERGIMERARFLVLESNTMKVGSTVGSVWFIQKPPPKPGMVTDADRFADFCTRLKGAPVGYPIGADIRTLVRDRAAEQLARGQVIRAYGVKKFAKTVTEKNKDGFVVVNWTHVPQTPAEIASMRAQIEAKNLHQEGTGGGQFQGAPHPAQMAQPGYQQQQVAQQAAVGAPQGWGQQQGPNPQVQVSQAWGQPQQGAPQQPAAPATPTGAPQGWNGNGGQGSW